MARAALAAGLRRLGVSLLLAAAANGCAGGAEVPEALTTVESARVRSPDGRLDAVLTAERGAPAIGVVHYLFVVPAGAAVTRADQPALSARDVAPAIGLRWIESDLVELSYDRARLQYFTNAAIVRASNGTPTEVELRLNPRGARALGGR